MVLQNKVPGSAAQASGQTIPVDQGIDKVQYIQDTLSIPSDVVTASKGDTGLVVKLPVNIVVNEVLCFVRNKVKQLPVDALVPPCADLYNVDVIVAAKPLLYNSVPTKSRQVFRKGANKSKISMSGIVKIFLEMEVTNVPIFVARNLSELPPLKMDSPDSFKVIQEIESTKSQILYVTNSQLELVNLVKSGAI